MRWLVLVALAGCHPEDECTRGAARCDGNVAESCVSVADDELGGHDVLDREDCGARMCVVDRGVALCALSASVDPACPMDGIAVAGCAGNTAASWTHCYRTAEQACAGTCVSCGTVQSAACSPDFVPSPSCGPGVATACEDTSTIVTCACGYRIAAHACTSPGPTCTTVTDQGGAPQGACR
jgi:hypothetical protein